MASPAVGTTTSIAAQGYGSGSASLMALGSNYKPLSRSTTLPVTDSCLIGNHASSLRLEQCPKTPSFPSISLVGSIRDRTQDTGRALLRSRPTLGDETMGITSKIDNVQSRTPVWVSGIRLLATRQQNKTRYPPAAGRAVSRVVLRPR